MNYDNYMALYEAVYFFDRMLGCETKKIPEAMPEDVSLKYGIHESVYHAVMRILVACKLLKVTENGYSLTPSKRTKLKDILTNIVYKNEDVRYAQLFEKAQNPAQFFFDTISDSECELYAQCNFQVTYETGKKVATCFPFSNKRILELGGNSGGLGSAIVSAHKKCDYTVVDASIPCLVGREYNSINGLKLTFIEANVFELNLPDQTYDCILMMNLLHDFDDDKCLDLVDSVKKYCHLRTKLLVIEDVLTSDFEPKEMIMNGLRLSAECRGGTQRTEEGLSKLLLDVDFALEETFNINPYSKALAFGWKH